MGANGIIEDAELVLFTDAVNERFLNTNHCELVVLE